MILKNLETNANIILSENDIDFHIVNSQIELSLDAIISCDAIVFRTDFINFLTTQIERIRKSDNPKVYLKPIYVSNKRTFLRLNKNVDGFLGENELKDIEDQVQEVVKRIKQIQAFSFAHSTSFHQRNFIKLCQFLWSRDQDLSPSRSRKAHIGYHYNFISYLIPDIELHQFIDFVQNMEKIGYVSIDLVERVSLCKKCSGSYLHFSETCHKCKSVDIEAESLIHHFRCAYIGPESDFKKDDDLICPKCDKMLRHIGVDYDKPSEIIHCHSCNHQAQQSAIVATCVDCGNRNELANLHTKEMFKIKLTEQGKNLALNPLSIIESSSSVYEQALELEIAEQLFDLLARQESKKKYAANTASYELSISFSTETTSLLTNSEIKTFAYEFKKILLNYLEEIDLFCQVSPHQYKLLLIAKNEQYIHQMLETLKYNINKVLNDNFNDPLHELTVSAQKL